MLNSLSRALCQHFNFLDARGCHQIGGCNKVLRELERAEHFIEPTSTRDSALAMSALSCFPMIVT